MARGSGKPFPAEYPRSQSKADLLWVSRGLMRGRKTYPMDNRFRFLVPHINRTVGRWKADGAEWKIPVQTEEVSGWQIRSASQRRDGANKSSEVGAMCREKPLFYMPVPQTDTGG